MINCIVSKFCLKFANRSYVSKIQYLRKKGASVGKQTRLICNISSFGSEPYLISIGENCLVSADVHFYTHDGGVKVLSDLGYFGTERMDIMAPIRIGNNVYIGTGASVFPGVTIGDNVVIGAHAVVTHDIPDNTVAVGMPARVIKSIEQYHQDALVKGYLYPTATLDPQSKREFYQKLFGKNEE